MKNLVCIAAVCALGLPVAAQNRPANPASARAASQTPGKSAAANSPAPATAAAPATEEERRALAYYNFSMGRLYERSYEQLYESGGRSEFANKAIDYYRRAYELDPSAAVIGERLAEIYAKSQRIRDAVLEAQNILKNDPNSLAARRLLARIYVRTLGELNGESAQRETVQRAIEQYTEIIRLDPGDTESALLLARLYRLQNSHTKAGEVLRNVLKDQPGNENALEQLTQLLIDQGESAEAVQLLEKATALEPTGALLGLLGEAYTQLENHAKAEQAYRRAVEFDGDDVENRRRLARSLTEQGKNEEAVGQYRQLTEAEPADWENHLRLAQLYRRTGKLDLAEQSILLAKQRSPGSLEIIYTEALIYESQARYDDAIRVLTGAVSSLKGRKAARPDENRRSLGILYEQIGRLYREIEDYTSAVSSFQSLMTLGKEEAAQGRVLVIESYRAGKQLELAIAESRKALDADPDDRGAQITHATLLGEKGDTDAAAKILLALKQANRDDREIYLVLAQVYERGRKFADAEESARRAEALARRPAENEMPWFLLGAIFERQKKYDQAEEFFKKVLQVNPRNAGALNYYGYMLAERGLRLDEAVELVKQALQEDQNNGAYLDSLGWAYFKQGKLDDAEQTLLRAVSRSRHDPTIREHLGDVYFKLGRIDRAAAEWEKSLVEWQRSLPSEHDSERISAVEAKLQQVKVRLAHQKATAESKPDK